MRLWSEQLISKLPQNQLRGQHRELSALRGLGWGRKHKTVNYVFKYDRQRLYDYHLLVMEEIMNRGNVNLDIKWLNHNYRGKRSEPDNYIYEKRNYGDTIYPEHNQEYITECINNLKDKGINITA